MVPHDIASEAEVHEQMVNELLVLVRLGDLWALQHILMIGVDESCHERAGHVELVDRIGIGRPTAVVEIETGFEHEVDVARKADIGLQTGSYVQTVS